MTEIKPTFYDGGRLLSMMDRNGKKPEIYMCTSNRNAGKTTYFARLLVKRFLEKGQKFMLLYRFIDELGGISEKFFKDIRKLFFKDYEMTDIVMDKGLWVELYINEVPCGYAVALNGADKIKKISHLFSDTVTMFMDEFQSETGKYCPNEVGKFISIHTSVARGNGEQVRYVPVYMVSNPVTLLNPYYTAMGISSQLSDAKMFRGDGLVLEQGFNESASIAQSESAFNRAFAQHKYVQYAAQAIYLNDTRSFIEEPKGKSRYICTIKFENQHYSVREFAENGFYYCSDKADLTFPTKLVMTTQDHDINYVMIQKNNFILQCMRYIFDHGQFRFKNLQCKDVIMKTLSY